MKKIVLVEDDELVANIYRNKLQLDGYQVELAVDGEQGLSSSPARSRTSSFWT